MTNKISSRDWETLSAYLDGELSPKDRRLLEAKLRTRGDLRVALEDLRRTRTIVRSHLPMRAPRNFTLTPEMAGISARKGSAGGLFPTLRLVSALASFLFSVVLAGDLLLARGTAVPMTAAEPAREMAVQVTESVVEAPAAAAPVPEIQSKQAAEPTPMEIAEALEAANPSLEASSPDIQELILTETAQNPPQGTGLGGGEGGGGGEEQQDQAALSAMAPEPTATPLPTPTLTPTPTPEPTPAALVGQARQGESQPPARTSWRWLEIILATVGVTTGLIAFYLYRTDRSMRKSDRA
jgi:hypothetical protein